MYVALFIKHTAVTRAVIALSGPIHRATEVGADRRHAAEGIALAHEEDFFHLQEGNRTINKVLGFTCLEAFTWLVEDIRDKKADCGR